MSVVKLMTHQSLIIQTIYRKTQSIALTLAIMQGRTNNDDELTLLLVLRSIHKNSSLAKGRRVRPFRDSRSLIINAKNLVQVFGSKRKNIEQGTLKSIDNRIASL